MTSALAAFMIFLKDGKEGKEKSGRYYLHQTNTYIYSW